MNKKYQIFVSSTYEDLIPERQAVIDAILQMEQFPAGMELFGASDEDQWSIITETMDLTDYYVLIIGRRYGTVIEDKNDSAYGISYTEKEFEYARSKDIPILVFVLDDKVPESERERELDPRKAAKLYEFREKATHGRMVKFWRNADDLTTKVSQSLAKAISRGNRPGWVRTTEFDIEKSHAEIIRLTERVHKLEELNADLKMLSERKPDLQIEILPDISEDGELLDHGMQFLDGEIKLKVISPNMEDADNGIDYRDAAGSLIHVDKDDVRLFRYLCMNAFPLRFLIHNNGDAKATGVRIKVSFPSHLLVISGDELAGYTKEDFFCTSDKAYEGWYDRFLSPGRRTNENEENRFVSIDELIVNDDIAELLDPADMDGGLSIFPGEVHFVTDVIRHRDVEFFRGVYVLPDEPGTSEIQCEILCDEIPNSIMQIFKVTVE